MLAKLRHYRLSHTTVVAYLALFVALGGTSFAAVTLKRNSVRSKHIKNEQVQSEDVKDASLQSQDFGAGQLPAGPEGPEGPQGRQGERGPRGPEGIRLRFTGQRHASSSAISDAGTVGPWTVSARCWYGVGLPASILGIYLRGPGSAEVSETRFHDAGPLDPTAATYSDFPSYGPHGPQVAMADAGSWSNTSRTVAQIQVQSDDAAATLTLHGFANNDGAGSCRLYGTGVPAS